MSAVAALGVAGFVLIRLATHGFDAGQFVVAGAQFVVARLNLGLPVAAHSGGYDGQFYYRLALDPLTRRLSAHGITLDDPSYRQQRIGYPLAAWALGHVLPITVAMIAVNAVALVAIAGIGACWARELGRSQWWGLAFAALPELVIGLARDLTEPLPTAFLLLGLLLWRGGGYGRAALLFTVALFCQETMVSVFAGMGCYWLWLALRRHNLRTAVRPLAALCLPAATGLGWQLYLRQVWGGSLPALAGGHAGLPLLAVVENFGSAVGVLNFSHQGILDAVWLVERIALIAFLVIVALRLHQSQLGADLRVGWLFALVMLLSVPWRTDGFLRAANEVIVLGSLLLLARGDRLSKVAARVVITGSVVVALMYAVAL